jgi:hypothetical protein
MAGAPVLRSRASAWVVGALALVSFGPTAAQAQSVRPGFVRYRGGIQTAAQPVCNSPHLSYFGGPILQSPTIVLVNWSSSVNLAFQSSLPVFFGDVAVSAYLAGLQEYDTVKLGNGFQQAVLPGTFWGSVTLTPSVCGGSTSCNLTDAQLQTELQNQITAGVLPAPTFDCTGNVNTVYMVEFPANVVMSGPGGIGKSCQQFCAYHGTTTYGPSHVPVVYGALFDVSTGSCSVGCGGAATALANATTIASHELAEAITDPDIGLLPSTATTYQAPAAWGDNNNNCGEVGDICDSGSAGNVITVSGRSWTVQQLWSNKLNQCSSAVPTLPVCSGTVTTSCRFCSCGDTSHACGGATPTCETTATSPAAGVCEACTSTTNTCARGQTCQQSTTLAQDDICIGTPTVPAAGAKTPWLAAALLVFGMAGVGWLRQRTRSATVGERHGTDGPHG